MKNSAKKNEPSTNDVKTYEKKKGEWFFESEEEEAMTIETIEYENGSIVKRCTLKDGRIAISRQLKGGDRHMITRISNGDNKKVQDAVVALSTKIAEKEIVIEDLDALLFSDYTKISVMASTLNFM